MQTSKSKFEFQVRLASQARKRFIAAIRVPRAYVSFAAVSIADDKAFERCARILLAR